MFRGRLKTMNQTLMTPRTLKSSSEPDPEDKDIPAKFSEQDPDDSNEYDEVTTKEIPRGKNVEVLEKTGIPLPSIIQTLEIKTQEVKEEDKEGILKEHQKDDDIAKNKEVAREQEVNKNVTNETEDDRKEKDQPKEKERVEEKPTADEVAVQEDEQAQPDRFPNECKDSELSASN
ncbi:hypothetical protein QQ045_018275 [Rhodiola kirilowii]